MDRDVEFWERSQVDHERAEKGQFDVGMEHSTFVPEQSVIVPVPNAKCSWPNRDCSWVISSLYLALSDPSLSEHEEIWLGMKQSMEKVWEMISK